jgi:dephospho-CoA kinase
VRAVLGLLGGMSVGKSVVARRIAALGGGLVVDADALAGEALEEAARDGRLEATLGPGFVRDGRPDRPAIARLVFGEIEVLRRLEALVHPPVRRRIEAALAAHAAGEGSDLLVLDVVLLVETGLDARCDALWFVEAPPAARARMRAARGVTEAEVARREAQQEPLDEKRARAARVIVNDLDAERLDRQIREGLASLGVAAAGRDALR